GASAVHRQGGQHRRRGRAVRTGPAGPAGVAGVEGGLRGGAGRVRPDGLPPGGADAAAPGDRAGQRRPLDRAVVAGGPGPGQRPRPRTPRLGAALQVTPTTRRVREAGTSPARGDKPIVISKRGRHDRPLVLEGYQWPAWAPPSTCRVSPVTNAA